MTENLKTNKKCWITMAIVAIVLCAGLVYMCLECFGDKNENINVIAISGHGEVSATPDIANISITISKEAKTVKEAQEEVAKVEKEVLNLLKTNSVDDKDIKTINSSFNPTYEYKYVSSYCTQYSCPSSGNRVIVGYEAYENISIKIRNIDDSGKIIQGLGALGLSELSGPNFAIDKEDELKAEARKEAIDDAQSKAKKLAKDLGIKLGDITSFNENGNYPSRLYASDMSAKLESVNTAYVAELPKGENTITSDVTITYEIR
ncbi:MAG TPA: SIMPL domain-containing protein [Candidatus Paceibacterota bacterium]|nr:SIMPL domain-containing protein [Candidatus Paceibacterota bacterium]HPT18316.1 SIMPL domain-containing protein [Candidatus Paceibacterota bacterium]